MRVRACVCVCVCVRARARRGTQNISLLMSYIKPRRNLAQGGGKKKEKKNLANLAYLAKSDHVLHEWEFSIMEVE